MSDPYPFLHNSTLPIHDRIQLAFRWLRNPVTCPIPDQGPASAKCYLIYRAIEGKLTDVEMDELVAFETPVQNVNLKARWDMSLTTALAYLRAYKGDFKGSDEYAVKVQNIWGSVAFSLWPPQILNYLRMTLVHCYYAHLTNSNTVEEIVQQAIHEWKKHVQAWDYKRWPVRPTEAHEDMRCIQGLLFVLRAHGSVNFVDMDWVNPEKILPFKSACPIHGTLRIMGDINPTKRIWMP